MHIWKVSNSQINTQARGSESLRWSIVSEPYFSELERAEEVKSPNPSLPMAKLTALGWILWGAFGVSRQLITAPAFGVHANKQKTFDLQTANVKKKKWSVQLPWIDPELESHRLTDNLKKVTAMMRKVHDVVLEEDMPMVDQARTKA